MESKKSQSRSRYSNLLFRIFIVLVFLSLAFCPAPVWAVQSDVGYVTIDGKKTIAMGWMKMGETNPAAGWPEVENLETAIFAEANEHGFDFVMQYGPWREAAGPVLTNEAEILAWMDAAEANDVKLLMDVSNCVDLPYMNMWVTAVKDHNALYGYYIGDEPDSRYYTSGVAYQSPAQIIANYNELRSVDPDVNHPAVIAFAFNLTDTRAQNYFPACEVAFAECYPTAWNPTYPSEYPFVAADVNVAKNAGLGYMTIPRLFGDTYIPFPTAEEFRYMVFAPISVGAGGFMPHIYEGWIPVTPLNEPEPGFRDVIVYPATDQLAAIREILVKGDLVATSDNASNDITWVFGGDTNEAVLVAVNNDPWNSKTSINFTVSGLDSSFNAAEVMGEDRMVILDGSRTFTETNFNPYGVHIYHFKHFNFSIPAENENWTFKAAPDWAVGSPTYNDGKLDQLQVGNEHGSNNIIYGGMVQFDLSAYAGQTVTGDGTLTLWAKLAPGRIEQPGGFDVRELTKDYAQGQANWNIASTGDAWTNTGQSFWDKTGCGDTGALVGNFTVTSETWTQETITVSQAQIQGWLGDSTVSLLIAVQPDYYGAFHFNKDIRVATQDAPEGSSNLELTFEAVTSPVCGDYDHPNPMSDLNDDCMVDFTDFVKLAGTWADDTAP